MTTSRFFREAPRQADADAGAGGAPPSWPPASIRMARAEDAGLLPEIERSAARRFRTLADLGWIADAEPAGPDEHRAAIAAGTVWVAECGHAGLVGFLAAERAGADLHVRELSVTSGHQGRGIGRLLLGAARGHAVTLGLAALTLTTFRDVAWNGPFYARLGFVHLPDDALGPRLRAILDREAAMGFSPGRRCAMRLALA